MKIAVTPELQEKASDVVYVQFKYHVRNKKGRLVPTKSASIKLINATIESAKAALMAGIAATEKEDNHADEEEARS